MRIDRDRVLRSFRNEAERQAAFYQSKGDKELVEAWSNFADMASEANETRTALVLSVAARVVPSLTMEGESIKSPTLIKGGEQAQQLRKPLGVNSVGKGKL